MAVKPRDVVLLRSAPATMAPVKFVEVKVEEMKLAEVRFWEEKSHAVRLLLESPMPERSRF